MKVKEYLVNRILELEKELKQLEIKLKINELEIYKISNVKMCKKIDELEIEREHIKELITCNINPDGDLVLLKHENDLKTLLSILDIRPED